MKCLITSALCGFWSTSLLCFSSHSCVRLCNHVLCCRPHRIAHRRPCRYQYQRSLRAATCRRPALCRPDLRRQRKCMQLGGMFRHVIAFIVHRAYDISRFFVLFDLGWIRRLSMADLFAVWDLCWTCACRHVCFFSWLLCWWVEMIRPSSTPLRLPTASSPS